MATTQKIEIKPVVPTELRHLRDLPPGQYWAILSGFRESVYLLRRTQDGALILIDWKGAGELVSEFVVHENGDLEYDDPNDRSDP